MSKPILGRRRYLAGVSSVALAGIVGCTASGEPGNDQTPSPTPTNTPTSTPTPTPEPTPESTEQLQHQAGDVFSVGNGDKTLQYSVVPDGLYDSVGMSRADGVYFVVKLRIKNVGAEQVALDSDMYTLINRDNDEYPPDMTAMLQMQNGIALERINPDIEITGVIPFDIPRGREGVEDVGERVYGLRISPAGVLSGASAHAVTLATVTL